MLLYLEASRILKNVFDKTASVKTLVFSSQYQNKKQLFALVQESLKYNTVLKQIVTNSQLLQREKLLKNDLALAEVLVYDFVIGNGLNQAAKLKQTILRNKTEILAQCERLKIKARVDSLVDLLPSVVRNKVCLPRYVRLNYLKCTRTEARKKLALQGWTQPDTVQGNHNSFMEDVRNLTEYQYIPDPIISDLLVFPVGTDLHDNPLIVSGELILQDKASCFPAHILNAPRGSHIIDSCAAPGNKTSHICSLIHNDGKIHAFDRDTQRLAVMKKLLKISGAACVTSACRDFLTVRACDPEYEDVQYILVDPSCSGSGMISRMNHIIDNELPMLEERLRKLSRFQILLLKHALRFPNVKRVVYSTCSIHAMENEEVVEDVYRQVSDQFTLVSAMPEWPERGMSQYEHAPLFCRLSLETALTNGFFIACFERRESDNPPPQHSNGCGKKKQKSKEECCMFSNVPGEENIAVTKTKKRKLSGDQSKHVKVTEFANIDENPQVKIGEQKQATNSMHKLPSCGDTYRSKITGSHHNKLQESPKNERKKKKNNRKKKNKPIA